MHVLLVVVVVRTHTVLFPALLRLLRGVVVPVLVVVAAQVLLSVELVLVRGSQVGLLVLHVLVQGKLRGLEQFFFGLFKFFFVGFGNHGRCQLLFI